MVAWETRVSFEESPKQPDRPPVIVGRVRSIWVRRTRLKVGSLACPEPSCEKIEIWMVGAKLDFA